MTSIFTGISAFPITPSDEVSIDQDAFQGLIERVVGAGVDSIGVLGTTGNYPYLTRAQRIQAIRQTVRAAGDIPVIAGVGALRTTEVVCHIEDAQASGAKGVLFSPMSYQPLTADEVYHLYSDVASRVSVPICLYDNPITTKFTFTDELYTEIAKLDNIEVVKVPAVPTEGVAAGQRAQQLRDALPEGTRIGVSGDVSAAAGLSNGFDLWFSVLGGLLPSVCRDLARAALSGDDQTASEISQRLSPIWDLNARYGSLRVTSALAAHLGLSAQENLPRPLLPLPQQAWPEIARVCELLADDIDADRVS